MPAQEPSETRYFDTPIEDEIKRIQTMKPDLCPACGADREALDNTFGEVHYCDPEWRRK